MSSAFVCTRCGAPLPPPNAPTVLCPYCKTTIRAGTPRTEIRAAVREVLHEERQQHSPPQQAQVPPSERRKLILIYAVSLGLPLTVGVVSTLISVGARVAHVAKSKSSATEGKTPSTPRSPTVAPKQRWGVLKALDFDERGDVVAVFDRGLLVSLVKADPQSLALRWTTPTKRDAFGYAIVPRGERLAVAGSGQIDFFDSSTGKATGTYVYPRSSILTGACAVGEQDVFVKVVSEGMRFDATTAKKSTKTGSCEVRDRNAIRCGADQSCGRKPVKLGELDCSYELRAGKSVFRTCKVDDGTGRSSIVSFDPSNKPVWRAEGDAMSYFGVVNGVLIAADRQRITAFEPTTGGQLWQQPVEGTTLSSGTRIYYGVEGTLAVADAKTGAELGRLPPPP